MLVALRQSLGECGLRVKAQQRRECNRVYIGNEISLEDRIAPATYLWEPPNAFADDLFSTPGNWWVGNARALVAPGPNDTVRFTLGGASDITIDAFAGNALTGLEILAGYDATITLNTDLTVTTTTQADGTIDGWGTYTVPTGGTYTWTGGSLAGETEAGEPLSSTNISPNATMNISGASDKTLEGRTLDNRGTINWTGTGDIALKKAAQFVNAEGSIFNASNGNNIVNISEVGQSLDGPTRFAVQTGAVFNKNDAGTVFVDTHFINDGAVNIQRGTIDSKGQLTVNNGAFDVNVNQGLAYLRLSDGTATFSGGTISGAGAVEVYNHLTVSAGTLTAGSSFFTLDSTGIIDGPGDFEYTGDRGFEWWGKMQGDGTTRFLANRDVFLWGGATIARSVENSGSVEWKTGQFNFEDGGFFTNDGTFDVQSDNNTMLAVGQGNSAFYNNGTFKKSVGADNLATTIDVPFQQSGILELQQGWLTFTDDLTQNAGGQTRFSGGHLHVQDTYTIENGSSLTVAPGTNLAKIWADELWNRGRIDLRNNVRTYLFLRDSGGQVNAHYHQTATGNLELNLTANNDNDWVRVWGTAHLGGTLTVTLAPGYNPPNNQVIIWEMMKFNARDANNFATVNRPNPVNNYLPQLNPTTYNLNYNPQGHPVAHDDFFFVQHGQSLNIPAAGVLDNDEGGSLTVTVVNGNGANVGTPITLTSGATLTVNSDGSFAYTPATAWTGQDSFTYTVSDGIGNSTATVYIDVTNEAPFADDDYYSVLHDQTLTTYANQTEYGVLQNDFDSDGDPLTVTAVNGSGANVGTQITLSSGGTLTVNADGSFIYTPASAWAGQDSFTYTVSDGIESDTATVYIDVTNEAPFADDDYYQVLHDQTLTTYTNQTEYGVLQNDFDSDGDSLTVTAINGSGANVGTQITLSSGGTLTVNADGSFTYTPPSAWAGQDSFTYTVSDGVDSVSATVFIDVTNEDPFADDDYYDTSQGQPLTIDTLDGLLANDSDNDGDNLSITQVNGSSANVGTQITLASGATLTVNADGSFTYTPTSTFTGQDSFTYAIFDGVTTTWATVFIDVF